MSYDEETRTIHDDGGGRIGGINFYNRFVPRPGLAFTADELRFIANTLDCLNGVDWTTAKPTEEGHYFYQHEGNEPEIVEVVTRFDGLYVYSHGSDTADPMGITHGKWGRKIEFPEVGK